MRVETWLKPNRKALLVGMVLPGLLAVCGFLLAREELPFTATLPLKIAGWTLFVLGILLVGALGLQLAKPRVGYQDGHLRFHLRSGQPICVPANVVEGFLLGRGPSSLPGYKIGNAETASVVVRLSEAAQEWAFREVKASLASWCNSYITIRGTWCEPLSEEMINQLNQRLAGAKQALPPHE